jgi:hypothetical protein
MDRELEGLPRSIKLYCVGGTYLSLSDVKSASKDLAFILSRRDFRTISGIASEIEIKERVRLDLFPDGEMTGYRLNGYEANAQRLPLSFEHIEVYRPDLVDFVLTKAIAGRAEDYEDIFRLVKDTRQVSRSKLLKRFKELQLEPGEKARIERNLQSFLKIFFKKNKVVRRREGRGGDSGGAGQGA